MDWRRDRRYRLWRIKTIRRDKVCQVCGTIKHRQSHHLNSGSYFPDERYDLKNSVTLCAKCHTNYHCNYHNSFIEKCNKYDYKNFMSLVKYIRSLT